MGNLQRYTASDLPALLDRISKNSIGMHDYLDRVFDFQEQSNNYPPYNLVQLNNHESKLEIALADGFKKKESQSIYRIWKVICRGQKRRIKRCWRICP